MIKKIGILTLSGNDNCGNKLQNYASIFFLRKMGYDSETIWVTNPFKDNSLKQILRFLKRNVYAHTIYYKRSKYFLRFNKLLNIKRIIIKDDDIKKLYNYYDYFFVGSDQVWNPNNFNNECIYFLKDSELKKNISFSASFGVSDVPNELKKWYSTGLNNFNYISVREDRGREIVEELTNKKADVLIDPTMLLSSEEWSKISKKPKKFDKLKNKKYILNYFLGSLSEDRKKEIDRVAEENNCIIINILDKNDPFYYCGPSEFLFLEKNAFLICTDSFHSSVFAFLFDKPFIVFDREQSNKENMNSRIETLINKFQLKNRKYNNKNITKDNVNHVYNESYKILEKERLTAKEFILKATNEK